MKKSGHCDRHGYNFGHACRISIAVVTLMLIFLTDDVMCQEKVPRWFYELPTSEDAHYAIGECGKYADHELQSLEARKVAAFRLAESVYAFIRFGTAEDANDREVRKVSFASVTIDTALMEDFLISMTVLDSCQLPGSFHLVVSSSESGHLPDHLKVLITPRTSIPQWVKSPPIEDNYVYGIGSSWKREIMGFEEAERLARVNVAVQKNVNLQTATWTLGDGTKNFNQVVSKQEFQMQLLNSQVTQRAVDDMGTKYVLVRMKR